jgi:thermopsin
MSAPAANAFRDQSSSLPFGLIIPPEYYEYVPIATVSSASTVSFVVSSNTTVSTAFMTSSQFTSFNNSQSDLSDSVYLHNATTAQDTQREGLGTFYLVFYAYDGHTANVSYNFLSYPVDPYYTVPLLPPEPTGVASYGLYNVSGNAKPYQIETSEVVGVADVSSLEASNDSASSAESNISGATLQLNTVLVVNESGGHQQTYWAQNTPDFVTADKQVAYGDNIWNFSVSGVLSNSTITSSTGGIVSPNTGSTGDYYSSEISNSTYSFPLVLALLVNETMIPGTGVFVQMGAQMLENGSSPATPVNWFDSATIHDPTVQSAYFLVAGNQTTPNGLYYDTEFAFCGENDGEATDFTQMAASLGVFYYDAARGALDSFPSLYSFGADTAEGADNLQVSYSGGAFAQISTGTPNYVYLGNSTGTLSLPLSLSEISSSSSYSIASTTSSSISSSASASNPPQSSSVTSSSSQPASSVSLPFSFLFIVLVAASVVAISVGFGLRTRAPARQLKAR